MAILQTKWVDVGVYTIYALVVTGKINSGVVSNTQNGSSNVNLDSVFSGADISSFTHVNSTNSLQLGLTGNRANSTFDTLKIGGVSFARTSATRSYNSSNNITTWTWSSVTSSPFGTTVGVDKQVTWETTGSSLSAPVVNNTQTFATTANNSTSCDVSLTSNGSGGTLEYNKSTSTTVPTNIWYTTSTVTGLTRGTDYYLWARRGVGYEDRTNSALTVPYLPPATGTAANDTILSGVSSHTASISGGAAGTVYEFRSGGYTGTILASVNGNDDATCSGGAGTYYVTHYKTTGTGGSGEAGRANLTTYTVSAVSKRTFTIQINYAPGNNQEAPTLFGPTVTVDAGSVTGSVTSSTNPLEVSVGDDVIWKRSNGLNTVTVSALASFTSNSNIAVTQAGVTRTLANGSNDTDQIVVEVSVSSYSASDYYYIERVGGITPPSGLSAGLDGAESQTEKVTLSQSTDGSGGTLEYLQRSVTSMASSGWQTSNEFDQTRNTTRYYWVSRNKNSNTYEGPLTVTVNYLGAVTTGYSFDDTPDPQAYGAGAPAIDFTAAQANHTVSIFEGNTARSSAYTGATVYAGTATTANVVAGGSRTYNLKTYRNELAGGNPSLAYVATDAGTTTVREYPQTPTITYGDNSESVENATTTATLTLTNTTGASTFWFRRVNDGTTFGDYVQDSNNVVTYADQTRSANQAYDYQGRIRGANLLFSESAVINAQQLTKRYLDPIAPTLTNADTENISAATSNFVVAFSDTVTDHTYKINVYGGTPGEEAYTGSDFDYSLTGVYSPGKGTDATYQAQVKRGTTSGGGDTYVNTGAAFTKSRFPDPASSIATFVDLETEAITSTFTITLNGRSGGSSTTVTLNSNYTSTTQTYGASGVDLPDVVRSGDTIYVRVTGSNGLTADQSFTTPATYLGAVTTGYSFDTASGNIGYGDGAPAISFTAAQANHTVAVFEGTTIRSAEQTGGTDYNNIATNETPPAGGSNTYNLRTYRNENAGGNPSLAYVATTASTIEIKRYPQTPTLGHSDNSASVESPNTTSTLTLTNTDGVSTYWFRKIEDGTAFGDYVEDSNNVVTYADQTRAANQAYDYQGRIVGGNGLVSESTVINAQQLTKRYLDPKAFSYSTPATIAYTDTSHVLTITGADSDHTYGWGIGVVGKGTATYTNSSTVTISSSSPLPEPGEQEDYVVSVRRGTASGGQNNLVSQTTPVNVKRYPQAPSGITAFTDGGAEATSGTFNITVGNLDGATATTLPTTITLSPNYTTDAVANGSDIASVVRAGDIVYARNTGSNGLTASAAIATPATYLLPNTPSLPDISNAYNTASHLFNITSMPTTVYYEVRTGGYTGTQRGVATTGGGSSTKNITVTQINTGGDTVTYYVRGYRLATAGGDEHWDNLGTYTVTEAGNTAASAFTFNPNSPVGLGLSQISNLITIAGLSTGTSANFSITGGTYSKNGSAYIYTTGTAVNGDTFKVKHLSSSSYSTSITTTLTVGGTSGSFVSTTAAPTLAPNNFTFTDESPVARGLPQTSNLITVAGLSSGYSTGVSVSGGTYSKNGGAYTSATDNTVVNDDTFRVRHTSSSVVSTAVNTTLTIGGVSDIYTTTTTSSYCPTTNTTHTITGITTTSSGTLSQSNIVSSNNALICSLTTPYVWLSSPSPGSAVTRSSVSVSVTSGGGNVSLNKTNNSTAHTITYTPPAITTEGTAVIQVQHRKQLATYSSDSGSYQYQGPGQLTTVNITVTICPVSQTSVSITSVDDITPVEETTNVVTASPVTASGVTISSYAWSTTNPNVISLSSSTVQSPTLTFGNVTSDQTATIGVTVTDSTGATATASQAYTVQFANQAPIASLTGASSVLVNTVANFDGSTSYDPDGTTSLTFAFSTSIANSIIDTQSASSTETYSFTPTSSGQYTISLTVSDGNASTIATKSLLASDSASATTTSAGGYGFEVYTAGGATIIRSDELLIRKVAVATADAEGVASATITGTEAGTLVLGTTAGEDNAGAQLTVTGTTTKSVSITGALANERIHLYLLR